LQRTASRTARKQVQPLSVGARAPIFAARTTEGALRTFLPDSYRKPTVVLFYRGGWCPYCNSQLSDLHLVEPAKAFHVAYHVDGATLAKMREYGVDLEATTGTKQHELPVPSVFIIDTSGTIRFVYSNPDYKIRLGADALWAAAQPLATVK